MKWYESNEVAHMVIDQLSACLELCKRSYKWWLFIDLKKHRIRKSPWAQIDICILNINFLKMLKVKLQSEKRFACKYNWEKQQMKDKREINTSILFICVLSDYLLHFIKSWK